MGASTIYKSTDTSAPALLASQTGLITVLDKVLVDGYGSKSGIGWTKEYQNAGNTKAAYRNKGTGYFLCVDSSTFPDVYYSSAIITVYEAMKDIDTGYIPMPDNGNMQYYGWANSQNGTPRDWEIIGDDKGFWICTAAFEDDYRSISYFGDYIPYYLEDQSNWVTWTACGDDDGVQSNILIITNSSDRIKIKRDQLNALPHFDADLLIENSFQNYPGNPLRTTRFPMFSKFFFSKDTTTLIGEPPGLYSPLHDTVQHGDIYSINANADIHIFSIYNIGFAGILVGEGFRP